MFSTIMRFIKLALFKKKWRELNRHNATSAGNLFPPEIVEVGSFTYGKIAISYFGNKEERLKIGNLVSVGGNVLFLLGGNHRHDCLTTFPFKAKVLHKEFEATTKGPIIVEDDVWIGNNCIILSGVTIGQGAVVAAGSVISKNVEPYSIVGGNPAKHIKYRFSEEIRQELIKLDLRKMDPAFIEENEELLYEPLSEENINQFISKLS